MSINVYPSKQENLFLISNFRLVLNVVSFLLGDSPESESYMLIQNIWDAR